VGEEKMSLRNRLSKSGENPEQDEAQKNFMDTYRNGKGFNVSEVNS
jgi:sterol O-acyltransferase